MDQWWVFHLKQVDYKQIIRGALLVGCLLTLLAAKLWQDTSPLYILVLFCCILPFFVDLVSALFCAILASGLIGLSVGFLPGVQLLLTLILWASALLRLVFFPDGLSDETAQCQDEADNAKRELLNAQQAQMRFVRRVNHDLRTPVNLIMGYCEAISAPYRHKEVLPQAYGEDIRAIQRNARQLQLLIDDLMNDTRTESIAASATDAMVDPVSVIREAADLVRVLLERHQIVLSQTIISPLPQLQINRTLFRQAVISLIKSAAQSSRQISLHLEARWQDTELHLRLDGTLLPVTAVDDGKTKLDNEGIADLRACKRIVDMYAGRLWLQAQEAGKTSVFITIPAQGTPLGTPYRAPAELLVLEDDIEILNLFRRHATRYSVVGIPALQPIDISSAHAAASAVIVSNARTQGSPPDIERITGKAIPVITCNVPRKPTFLQDYGLDYLMKPVTFAALSTVLNRMPPPLRNILVLDDNHEIVQLFCQLLSAIVPDARIWSAYSGQEGLALLSERPLDAIILDITLPDMNGLTVVEQIRSDLRYKNTPIVLISGTSPDENATADGHISVLDPTIANPADLIRRVETLVAALDTK